MDARQTAISFFRKSRLLWLIEQLRLWKKTHESHDANHAFVAQHPDFPTPPLDLMYDAYAHCYYDYYMSSGISHANVIADMIKRYKTESDLVVCEWGCGPARVVRHLQAVHGGIRTVIGTDYNQQTISWCQREFPHIRFLKNGLAPPLDISDHSLDVLYCISVFTHLSELMHYAWMNEIQRVLKPGGLFIGTFQGEKTKHKLLPSELLRYSSGELVVRNKVKEGSRLYSAFHSDVFVEKKLLAQFSNVQKDYADTLDHTIWCAIAPQQ